MEQVPSTVAELTEAGKKSVAAHTALQTMYNALSGVKEVMATAVRDANGLVAPDDEGLIASYHFYRNEMRVLENQITDVSRVLMSAIDTAEAAENLYLEALSKLADMQLEETKIS